MLGLTEARRGWRGGPVWPSWPPRAGRLASRAAWRRDALLPLVQHAGADHPLTAAEAAVDRRLQVLRDASLHVDRHRLLAEEGRRAHAHPEVGVAIELRDRRHRADGRDTLLRHLVGLLQLRTQRVDLRLLARQCRRQRRLHLRQLVHVHRVGALRTRRDVDDLTLLRVAADRHDVLAAAVRRVRADRHRVRTRGDGRVIAARAVHVGRDAVVVVGDTRVVVGVVD